MNLEISKKTYKLLQKKATVSLSTDPMIMP